MRYRLPRVCFVLFCVMVLLWQTGCQSSKNTPTTKEDSSPRVTTSDMPEEEETQAAEEEIELPPPSIQQPVDEILKGYPAQEMRLVQTVTDDGYSVELTFEGLSKVGKITLPDTSFGTIYYNHPSQQVSVIFYTHDFEHPHQLYQGHYKASPWEETAFLCESYEDGALQGQVDHETQEFEPMYTPEEYGEIAQKLFALLQKEMAKRGENLP